MYANLSYTSTVDRRVPTCAGVRCDPSQLSEHELERITRKLVQVGRPCIRASSGSYYLSKGISLLLMILCSFEQHACNGSM